MIDLDLPLASRYPRANQLSATASFVNLNRRNGPSEIGQMYALTSGVRCIHAVQRQFGAPRDRRTGRQTDRQTERRRERERKRCTRCHTNKYRVVREEITRIHAPARGASCGGCGRRKRGKLARATCIMRDVGRERRCCSRPSSCRFKAEARRGAREERAAAVLSAREERKQQQPPDSRASFTRASAGTSEEQGEGKHRGR